MYVGCVRACVGAYLITLDTHTLLIVSVGEGDQKRKESFGERERTEMRERVKEREREWC